MNCASQRARLQFDANLEECSKKIESSVNKLQVKQLKSQEIEESLKILKHERLLEIETHLAWLKQRKHKLDVDLDNVDKKIREKKEFLTRKYGCGL
jgi:hypothetical protein